MRGPLDAIVILTISLVAVALERPNSTPAKPVTAQVGTATQHSDTELVVQMEKDLFRLTANPDQHLPWSKLQTDGTDVFVKEGGTWTLRLSRGSPHSQQ